MNKIIYRSLSNLSADKEKRQITGQAVVFDSWSKDLGGFNEIIRSSAITEDLLKKSDIIMNINHDNDKMVARYYKGNGTLSLELKSDGLYFSFDAPTTSLGEELLFNVRNNNLFECSFAFTLPDNDTCQRWYKEDGKLKREITEIGGLYDCSIVTVGAYGATSCSARNLQSEQIDLDVIKSQLEAAEELRKQDVIQSLNKKLEVILEDNKDLFNL